MVAPILAASGAVTSFFRRTLARTVYGDKTLVSGVMAGFVVPSSSLRFAAMYEKDAVSFEQMHRLRRFFVSAAA